MREASRIMALRRAAVKRLRQAADGGTSMGALMGIAYALEMEESDVREIVKRRARSSFPGSRGPQK